MAALSQETINAIAGAVNTQMAPHLELLKTLSGPARASGMSPVDMVQKHTQGGTISGVYGPDGRFYSAQARYNPNGRRMGTRIDPSDGKEKSFSTFLKSMVEVATRGSGQAQGWQVLKDYNTQSIRKDGDMIVKTALAESSGITGGYTVPPVFSTELLMLSIEDQIVEEKATKHNIPGRTLTLPSLDQTTSNTPGVPGTGRTNFTGGVVPTWVAEAQTRPESEPQFKQTTLTAWELSFIAIASNTLLEDEAVGLDALLTQLFGWAIGWNTDYAYLQGNGVGKPLGMINCPAAIQVARAAAGHIRYSDIGQMMSRLYWPIRGNKGICWIAHQSVIPELWAMTDNSAGGGQGRLVFQSIDQGAQEPIGEAGGPQTCGYLGQYPVMITEKVPALGSTADIGLYHLPSYLLGKRQEIEIALSPHVYFTKNQMVWRVVWRGDGQPWINAPYVLADGTYQVSPFVLLAA